MTNSPEWRTAKWQAILLDQMTCRKPACDETPCHKWAYTHFSPCKGKVTRPLLYLCNTRLFLRGTMELSPHVCDLCRKTFGMTGVYDDLYGRSSLVKRTRLLVRVYCSTAVWFISQISGGGPLLEKTSGPIHTVLSACTGMVMSHILKYIIIQTVLELGHHVCIVLTMRNRLIPNLWAVWPSCDFGRSRLIFSVHHIAVCSNCTIARALYIFASQCYPFQTSEATQGEESIFRICALPQPSRYLHHLSFPLRGPFGV